MPAPQLFLCNFSGVDCFVPLIGVHCVASTRNQGKTGGTKECAPKYWCLKRLWKFIIFHPAWMFHFIASWHSWYLSLNPRSVPHEFGKLPRSCHSFSSVLWPGKGAIKTFWCSQTSSIHVSFSCFLSFSHGTNLIFQKGRCGNSSAPRSRCRDKTGRVFPVKS